MPVEGHCRRRADRFAWRRRLAFAGRGHLAQLAVSEATPADRLAELINRSLDEGFGGRIVLVTTRPAGFAEATNAFNQVPQYRAALDRMLSISAASNELFDYFHVDSFNPEPTATARTVAVGSGLNNPKL